MLTNRSCWGPVWHSPFKLNYLSVLIIFVIVAVCVRLCDWVEVSHPSFRWLEIMLDNSPLTTTTTTTTTTLPLHRNCNNRVCFSSTQQMSQNEKSNTNFSTSDHHHFQQPNLCIVTFWRCLVVRWWGWWWLCWWTSAFSEHFPYKCWWRQRGRWWWWWWRSVILQGLVCFAPLALVAVCPHIQAITTSHSNALLCSQCRSFKMWWL